MPALVEKETGKSWEIAPDDMEAAVASGLYEVPADTKVSIVDDSTGLASEVAAGDLGKVQALRQGVRAETEAELRGRENLARIEREHGGALGAAGAFTEGFADAATLGGYGALTRAILPDSYTENRRERAQSHDVASLAGTGLGIVLPALASGGAGAAGSLARATPAGLAARVGTGVSQKLGGGILGVGAGMAAEGAIQGAGAGVSELTISADPITVERAVAAIGSNALLGGAVAGSLGVGGKALGATIKRVGGAARELAQSRAVTTRTGTELVGDIRGVVDGAGDAFIVAETGRKPLQDAFARLRKLGDEPIGLAERPKIALDPIRRMSKVVRETIAEEAALSSKLAKESVDLATDLGEQIATAAPDAEITLSGTMGRRYSAWSGTKVPKKGLPVSIENATAFKAALEAGEVAGARAAAMERLPQFLAKLEDLEKAIVSHGTVSPIAAAFQKVSQGFALGAMTGFLPGGLVGAAAGMVLPGFVKKVGEVVAKRLSAATAESTSRTSMAIDAFLDTGKRAARTAPPLATRVLSSVRFGPEAAGPAPQVVADRRKSKLLDSFRERERELRDQTTTDAKGAIVMKPEARRAVSERLAGVKVVSPELADQMESVAARRAEFLASKLPRRPDIVGLQIGPDRWRPSDMAMRTFARYVAAVEDPGAVEERLADGTVTPEDAEAYRTVYPERYARLRLEIVQRLPELRASLPYRRKVALSIFTGIPVDPAMHPVVVRALQGTFVNEEGTEGGTQAPTARPQFGSVSKQDDATPAQRRAG